MVTALGHTRCFGSNFIYLIGSLGTDSSIQVTLWLQYEEWSMLLFSDNKQQTKASKTKINGILTAGVDCWRHQIYQCTKWYEVYQKFVELHAKECQTALLSHFQLSREPLGLTKCGIILVLLYNSYNIHVLMQRQWPDPVPWYCTKHTWNRTCGCAVKKSQQVKEGHKVSGEGWEFKKQSPVSTFLHFPYICTLTYHLQTLHMVQRNWQKRTSLFKWVKSGCTKHFTLSSRMRAFKHFPTQELLALLSHYKH